MVSGVAMRLVVLNPQTQEFPDVVADIAIKVNVVAYGR
jgi:hypothetical protein